jgi:hypothetical protein
MNIKVPMLAGRHGILLMHRTAFLIVTALGEGVTGLALLLLPRGPLALLLGLDQASPEVSISARIAGAGLIAIGVACWIGRSDQMGPSQIGLLSGVLAYDAAAAAILAYTGLFVNLVGIALWPAVVVHAALAVWCVVCLCDKPRAQDVGIGAGLKVVGPAKEDNG